MANIDNGAFESLFEGSRCRLVPLGPEHYEPLRRLEVTRLGLWWRARGAVSSPDEFVRRIWDGTTVQCLGFGLADDAPLLWLQCYGADPVNQTASLAVARLSESVFSLRAASCLAAFMEYCFRSLHLRKLYLEVAAPNLPLFSGAVGSLFVQEGRLEDHVRSADGWEDLYLLCLWREVWQSHALRNQMLSRF